MESPKQARTTIVSTVVAIISTTIIPSIVATVLLHTQIPHGRNGPIRKGVLDAKQNPFFEQRLHTTKPHQPTYIATIVAASSGSGSATATAIISSIVSACMAHKQTQRSEPARHPGDRERAPKSRISFRA
jgi:hypothetical protein